MHEKFRKESNDGVVSGKGWKTRHKDNKIYSTLPPSHSLFYANPNSRPSVVSPFLLHVLKQRGDRGTVNRQSISIGCFYAFGYTFKSLTPNLTRYNSRICNSRRRRRVCTPKERGLMPLSPHTCTNL